MRKIEKRAALCLVLAAGLALGLCVFLFFFIKDGGDWAAAPFDRHLYNSSGQLMAGTVLDRDGDVLSSADDGQRSYYPDETVRRATLHAVGDPGGKIGTAALSAFADRLSGYNLLTGASSAAGNDLTLTLDARYNYIAYRALGGHKGAVAVYNYKTGEILCMVSAPAFDPLHIPDDLETDPAYEGAYVNRVLSSAFTPGSTFKTVTLAAAIDAFPDLFDRTWTCTGEGTVGGGAVTCPRAHGQVDIYEALADSCNYVFGSLAAELGPEAMASAADKAGLTASYSVNGISTARGSFTFSGLTDNALAWAGVGQGEDRVNPCAMMVYMGAVASGGKAAVPQLIKSVHTQSGFPVYLYWEKRTGALVSAQAAAAMGDMMRYDVEKTYGADRFPNMDICAKSGTAQVGADQAPHAWFTGFLRNADAPYAFVVLVENGGSGADTAGNVAAAVLDAIVNGY